MKNKTRSFAVLGLVLVAALLVGSLPTAGNAKIFASRDEGTNQLFPTLEHMGAKVCRSEEGNATAVECATTSGVLYSLCVFGTAAVRGKAGQAFDTAVASTITAFMQAGRWISPLVYGTANIPTATEVKKPCWTPKGGVRFENGLAIKSDSIAQGVMATYRLDSGTNP